VLAWCCLCLQPKTARWSKQKEQKEKRKKKKEEKREKNRKRPAEPSDEEGDLEDLAKDARLIKKHKSGKVMLITLVLSPFCYIVCMSCNQCFHWSPKRERIFTS